MPSIKAAIIRKTSRKLPHFALPVAIILSSGISAFPASADTVRVYEDENGNRLITSRIMQRSKYTLVDKFGKRELGLNRVVAYWRNLKPRDSRYNSYVRQVASRYDIPPSLVMAVIHTESAFNPNAESNKGAGGLMQLMPDTAKEFGVKNRFDPKDNIDGGVKYLAYLMNRFNGQTHLALAAYNAGPGAVQKYDGIPPYKETQNYVAKVLYLNSMYAREQ